MEEKILGDFHSHTVFSHGKGTIEDNVKKAIEKGLKAIAITDHGFGQKFAGITPKSFLEMRKEVERLKPIYPQIKILLGVEANIINKDGKVDLTKEQEEMMDLILCGFHMSATEWKIKSLFEMVPQAILWKMGSRSSWQREINTKTYLNVIENYPIDVLTHPGHTLDVNYLDIGNACANKDTYIEISSRHKIPTDDALLELLKTDVKFIINSDAHKVNEIGEYDYALYLMNKYKLQDRVVNYKNIDFPLRSKKK